VAFLNLAQLYTTEAAAQLIIIFFNGLDHINDFASVPQRDQFEIKSDLGKQPFLSPNRRVTI
jgi:hypothetical protein